MFVEYFFSTFQCYSFWSCWGSSKDIGLLETWGWCGLCDQWVCLRALQSRALHQIAHSWSFGTEGPAVSSSLLPIGIDDLSEEAATISTHAEGPLLTSPILKYASCLSEWRMDSKYFDVLQPAFGGLCWQTCQIVSPRLSQNGFFAGTSENFSCN